MQFQFLKDRYCLSFAVLFHFSHVPVMRTVIQDRRHPVILLRNFVNLIYNWTKHYSPDLHLW